MLWWDGYADFIPDSGDVQTEAIDCTLCKVPDNLIDESDLAMVHPKWQQMADLELDVPRALREARDLMLLDLGGKNRAQTMIGVDSFRRAAALKFFLLRRHTMGDEWKQAMDPVHPDAFLRTGER